MLKFGNGLPTIRLNSRFPDISEKVRILSVLDQPGIYLSDTPKPQRVVTYCYLLKRTNASSSLKAGVFPKKSCAFRKEGLLVTLFLSPRLAVPLSGNLPASNQEKG